MPLTKPDGSDALPVALIGMNAKLMCRYIELIADRLLVSLGNNKVYIVTNPFNFMNMISLQGKTNIFKKCVLDYSKVNGNHNSKSSTVVCCHVDGATRH